MPTSKEIVSNRPLSGIELREIIVADLDRIMRRDGMFTEYLAYGRVSYEVGYKLHLDNPAYPDHKGGVKSGRTKDRPELEPPPLALPVSSESVVVAGKRERTITSPNKERIRRNMPLKVESRSPEHGHIVEKDVQFDMSMLDEKEQDLDEGVTDTDESKKAKDDWGI